MAQNDCQKYTDVNQLYQSTRNVLSTFWNSMNSMERLINFLETADATTYPAIPIETLTAFAQLRTALSNHASSAETVALMTKIKLLIQI